MTDKPYKISPGDWDTIPRESLIELLQNLAAKLNLEYGHLTGPDIPAHTIVFRKKQNA